MGMHGSFLTSPFTVVTHSCTKHIIEHSRFMDNLGTSYAVIAKSYICAHPLHLFIIRQMTYVVDGERARTYILIKKQMMTNAL